MFQGTIIRNEPAFRPRPAVLPGYHKFSQGQYDAFVAVSALDHIAHEAQQAAPNETIGYLVGRPFRDAKGVYAVVTDAITATSARRGRATVETTLDDERQLLDTLLAKHPTSEKLGWFHSHPFYMPSYSSTDSENQQFWSESYHLGLLATLECQSDTASISDAVTIHAFRGPESERLQPPYTTADRIADESFIPTSAFHPSFDLAQTGCGRRPNSQRAPRRWPSLVAASIVVGIVWPTVYLVGVWMIIQATRENAAQVAKDIRGLRSAAESNRTKPQDIKDLSSPQQETAPLNGSGEKLHAKPQAVEERPQGKDLYCRVSATMTEFARYVGKHVSPKTDGEGATAQFHTASKGR